MPSTVTRSSTRLVRTTKARIATVTFSPFHWFTKFPLNWFFCRLDCYAHVLAPPLNSLLYWNRSRNRPRSESDSDRIPLPINMYFRIASSVPPTILKSLAKTCAGEKYRLSAHASKGEKSGVGERSLKMINCTTQDTHPMGSSGIQGSKKNSKITLLCKWAVFTLYFGTAFAQFRDLLTILASGIMVAER